MTFEDELKNHVLNIERHYHEAIRCIEANSISKERVREDIEKVQFNSWQDKKKLLKLLGIEEK